MNGWTRSALMALALNACGAVDPEVGEDVDAAQAAGGATACVDQDSDLESGVTWMMLKEHRALMGDERAKQVLEKLRRTPMNAWPRYWQDAAFSTIHNWERTGAGASHWAGGRWHC